ncbi:MAG: DUF885 domain-containing protein, partial [Erythrobacter sp.]
MMRTMVSGLALVMAMAGPALADPVEDYEALREEVWQSTLDASPTLATSIGDRRGDGQLGDLSLAEYD